MILRKQYIVNVSEYIDQDFLKRLKKLEDRLFVAWNYRYNCFEIYRSCGLNPAKYVLRCGTVLDRRILERLAEIDTLRKMQFDTFDNNFKRFEEEEEISLRNEMRKEELRMEDINEMNAYKMSEAMEGLNFGSHMGRENSVPNRRILCTVKK